MKLSKQQVEDSLTAAWGTEAVVVPYHIHGNRRSFAVRDRGDQVNRASRPFPGERSPPMPDTPTDDQPGFLAEEPEHCRDCYRLMRRGDRYFLRNEQAVVCLDCFRTTDALRLGGVLTVEVGEDRLLVGRGRKSARYHTSRDLRELGLSRSSSIL